MGLGYFFILVTIAGSAGLAVFLLAAAHSLWNRSGHKLLAAILLFPAGLCAAWALYVLAIFLKEPPWAFHF